MSTMENEVFLEQAKEAAMEAGLTEAEAEMMAEEALKAMPEIEQD